MFFPDKQPIQCSETTVESIVLLVFNMSETGPVEHTKVQLGQRLSKPIQCTEPPSAPEQALPSYCVAPTRTAFNHPALATMQDLLPI